MSAPASCWCFVCGMYVLPPLTPLLLLLLLCQLAWQPACTLQDLCLCFVWPLSRKYDSFGWGMCTRALEPHTDLAAVCAAARMALHCDLPYLWTVQRLKMWQLENLEGARLILDPADLCFPTTARCISCSAPSVHLQSCKQLTNSICCWHFDIGLLRQSELNRAEMDNRTWSGCSQFNAMPFGVKPYVASHK